GSARVAIRGDSLTSLVSKKGPTAAGGAAGVGAAATTSTTAGAITGTDARTAAAGISRGESLTRTGLLATAGTGVRRGNAAGVVGSRRLGVEGSGDAVVGLRSCVAVVGSAVRSLGNVGGVGAAACSFGEAALRSWTGVAGAGSVGNAAPFWTSAASAVACVAKDITSCCTRPMTGTLRRRSQGAPTPIAAKTTTATSAIG